MSEGRPDLAAGRAEQIPPGPAAGRPGPASVNEFEGTIEPGPASRRRGAVKQAV